MPKPVALTIQGKYWDVQLYRGLMYLFGRDAVIRVVNWDGLVASWDSDPRLGLAFEMSFRESSLAYRLLLSDPRLVADTELQLLMASKFDRLSNLELEVSHETLERFTVAVSDSPFPFPHADTEIHYGWLLAASDEGIDAAQLITRRTVHRRRWHSPELIRIWDRPSFGLAASYRSVAAAIGDDGLVLLKLPNGTDEDSDRSDHVGAEDGTFIVAANWIYASILGSAQRGAGLMLRYGWEPNANGGYSRNFLGVVPGNELLGDSEYSWGNRDKVFTVSKGTVEAMKFRPTDDLLGKLDRVGEHKLPVVTQVIDAGTAIFGTAIELTVGLLLILTNGETVEIGEQPVKWRLYPRSTFYDNQIHMIFEDRLLVLSFNHDFFLDQARKAWGSRLDVRRLTGNTSR